MKKFVLMLLTAASVIGSGGTVSAQMYGGPYYGPDPYYRDRYRERYYGEDRYYRERYYQQGRRYRTWNGCPPNFTVQDGVCKPYRGY